MMLDETNVNVLGLIISFIQDYSRLLPITQVPVEVLVERLLNFTNIHGLCLEETLVAISQKSSRTKIVEALGKAFASKSPKRTTKAYKILTSLIQLHGLSELMYLEGAIEDLSVGFSSPDDDVREAVLELMKEMYSRAGECILGYAKHMNYPQLQRLNEFCLEFVPVTPFESFPERMLYREFSFASKYPEEFLSSVLEMKVRCLNECLKEMSDDSEKKNLKEEDLSPILNLLVTLSKRRNPTSNRLISSMLNNFCQRVASFSQYSLRIVEIVFELVGCKHLLETLLHRQHLIVCMKFEDIEAKMLGMEPSQAEYNRAIKLLRLLSSCLSDTQKEILVNHLSQCNLNHVYRLELESLGKR